MNERLKQVRRQLLLNQADFGTSLGLTASAISAIEKGKRSVTEQLVMLLSLKYDVNENWLKTGKGEVFNTRQTNNVEDIDDDEEIAYVPQNIESYIDKELVNSPQEHKKILAAFASLSLEERKAIIRFAQVLNLAPHSKEDELLMAMQSTIDAYKKSQFG